jgi:hypothetical protein
MFRYDPRQPVHQPLPLGLKSSDYRAMVAIRLSKISNATASGSAMTFAA